MTEDKPCVAKVLEIRQKIPKPITLDDAMPINDPINDTDEKVDLEK